MQLGMVPVTSTIMEPVPCDRDGGAARLATRGVAGSLGEFDLHSGDQSSA